MSTKMLSECTEWKIHLLEKYYQTNTITLFLNECHQITTTAKQISISKTKLKSCARQKKNILKTKITQTTNAKSH